MSLSESVAAPSPVTIGGKTYTAGPVDLAGLGELEEHARARVLSIAVKAAATLPADLADRLTDRALKLATATTFDSEEFNKFLNTKRGMAAMLSIALRPRHPGVTPEDVARMTEGRDAELVAAVDAVLRISGFGGGSAEGKAGPQAGEGQPGEAAAGAASGRSSDSSSNTTDFSPATSAA